MKLNVDFLAAFWCRYFFILLFFVCSPCCPFFYSLLNNVANVANALTFGLPLLPHWSL